MANHYLYVMRCEDCAELVKRHAGLQDGAARFDGFSASIEDILLIVKAEPQRQFGRWARDVERIQHHGDRRGPAKSWMVLCHKVKAERKVGFVSLGGEESPLPLVGIERDQATGKR